eukprot:876701-Amorphochlora_amoeboformis.AAC.2
MVASPKTSLEFAKLASTPAKSLAPHPPKKYFQVLNLSASGRRPSTDIRATLIMEAATQQLNSMGFNRALARRGLESTIYHGEERPLTASSYFPDSFSRAAMWCINNAQASVPGPAVSSVDGIYQLYPPINQHPIWKTYAGRYRYCRFLCTPVSCPFERKLKQVMDMGFSRAHAVKGLQLKVRTYPLSLYPYRCTKQPTFAYRAPYMFAFDQKNNMQDAVLWCATNPDMVSPIPLFYSPNLPIPYSSVPSGNKGRQQAEL